MITTQQTLLGVWLFNRTWPGRREANLGQLLKFRGIHQWKFDTLHFTLPKDAFSGKLVLFYSLWLQHYHASLRTTYNYYPIQETMSPSLLLKHLKQIYLCWNYQNNYHLTSTSNLGNTFALFLGEFCNANKTFVYCILHCSLNLYAGEYVFWVVFRF